MTPRHVVESIRMCVSDWSASDADICAELNAATIPIPAEPPLVPRHLSSGDLLGMLSPESAAQVAQWVNLPLAIELIDGQDHQAAANMIRLAIAASIITPEEGEKCLAYVNEQVPDPDYCEMTSWAQTTIGRPVTVNDVAAARSEA